MRFQLNSRLFNKLTMVISLQKTILLMGRIQSEHPTAKIIDSLPEKGGLMNTKKIHGKRNATLTELASYFGLVVEITLRMTNYSLICCRDRESVVETEDLLVAQRRAA